jgi:gliding motility-associated-like protein
MNKVLLLFFTLLSINCFSQLSKTHFIPPLTSATVGTSVTPQDQYLYISTPTLTDVPVTITPIGGTPRTELVSNTNPWVYSIKDEEITSNLFTPSTAIGIIRNKGYIVEAPDLIYTSVRLNLGSLNQAGGLVSKGNSALGKVFRIGAMINKASIQGLMNFASILATENDTHITITLHDSAIGTTLTDGTLYTGPIDIELQKDESYIIAFENNGGTFRSNVIIGGLIDSDKNVVVNSGSIGGTNYETGIIGDFTTGTMGRDVGFDQIVSFEKTGKEYIFIKGLGSNSLERVLLIAHENNTQLSINGSATTININAGEYIVYDGHDFIDNNLYVKSTENIFAYQSIGGDTSAANQNLFFVPPLNCSTPNTVNNIPKIDLIGTTSYTGTINIVTKAGARVLINNVDIPASTAFINSRPDYVYYSVSGRSGNTTIKSDKEVYVSYYGTNINATYGGYYSGFDLKPEITFNNILSTSASCMPNIELKVPYDPLNNKLQWIFNGIPIDGETSGTYIPSLLKKGPGYYKVKKIIICDGFETSSDEIPVSDCPIDTDGDGVYNNIDIDNDNDGITNCTESYGDQSIAVSSLPSSVYSNSYTGSATATGPGANTFTGNTDDSFTTRLDPGVNNAITYKLDFNNPISLGLKYNPNTTATLTSLANGEFVIKSDIDKTITVLNPSNQLLIDTDYNGNYKDNVTEYSSFEIRFRLNGPVLLPSSGPVPAVDFKFQTYLSKSISLTHKNLSDTDPNNASFSFYAVCVPKDTDGDGIPDQLDKDSDADGILDLIESQTNTWVALSNSDANKDGLDDAFEPGFTPIDTDNDLIPDYLDLDSDNDGIYDKVETGSLGTDTDGDGIKNYRELDSDNDGCNDVIEAGFADPNNDGLLGAVVPPTVNTNGTVSSGTGYTAPNNNYITAAPIVITTQPTVLPTCNLQNATITITDDGGNSYRWQISTNGTTWTNVPDDATYSGGVTNTLAIKSVKSAMNGYTYRVQLNKVGNACGLLSNETTLTVYPLPVVNPVTIVQCDDDSDGFSNFNLTVKNNTISSDPTAQFSYYTSFSGAENSDPNKLINNTLSFKNTTAGSMSVWARTENSNGCFSVSQVNLVVSTTQIPPSYNMTFEICDDLGTANDDTDGIATFDFSSVTTDILRILPDPNTAYSIKYYKNEQDALSENDEILNTTNYRNEGYRDEQRIWVRVESTADNACYGLSPRILLKVNPKPNIDTNEDQQDDELVCSNLPSFFVRLDCGIQDGSPESDYTYQWTKDNMSLTSETMSFLEVNAVGTYSVKVNSAFGCSRTRTIKVTASDVATIQSIDIVDLAETNTVTVNVTGQGIYEYSLDAPNGPFQLSNFFDNVSAGIHDVYVNDQNGCGTITKAIAVLGVPKFFTPNGDGFNDYWNLKGANATFKVKSIIYIYDRYGKLVFQVDPSSRGWDGTYNKSPLPADDYWFTIKLENGREATGHFSLKR